MPIFDLVKLHFTRPWCDFGAVELFFTLNDIWLVLVYTCKQVRKLFIGRILIHIFQIIFKLGLFCYPLIKRQVAYSTCFAHGYIIMFIDQKRLLVIELLDFTQLFINFILYIKLFQWWQLFLHRLVTFIHQSLHRCQRLFIILAVFVNKLLLIKCLLLQIELLILLNLLANHKITANPIHDYHKQYLADF